MPYMIWSLGRSPAIALNNHSRQPAASCVYPATSSDVVVAATMPPVGAKVSAFNVTRGTLNCVPVAPLDATAPRPLLPESVGSQERRFGVDQSRP
jgi:hypothetical protein